MRRALALLLLLLPLGAQAQPAVQSSAPDAVQISVYRDPDRGEGGIDPRWPSGFALITETRTISLPAGEAVVRFEGVMDSILSESAIVTGLPGGVEQKNRDAQVLSPAALLEFAIGKRVHIRRTDKATGDVREEEAIVRAGPRRGVVIETQSGVEALRCSGLPEALVYDAIPAGLSDKPVLSVTTRSERAVTATVTLSYLAGGFDWSADYIAHLSGDGRSMDLFAWATLANGNGQGLADAQTSTIAGRLNRTSENSSPPPSVPMLRLGCWPLGTTSDIPETDFRDKFAPPPPPPAPAPFTAPPVAMDIVVTGSRVARMMAEQEDLADLKLYRIPEPVAVAGKSQKQVAILNRKNVPVDQIVSFEVGMSASEGPVPGGRLVRTQNDEDKQLGLALPAGSVQLFTVGRNHTLLTGRAEMRDLAIGEEVELRTGSASDIQLVNTIVEVQGDGRYRMRTVITNATSAAQRVEVRYRPDEPSARMTGIGQRLGRRNGNPLWSVLVPANAQAVLDYRVRANN